MKEPHAVKYMPLGMSRVMIRSVPGDVFERQMSRGCVVREKIETAVY